MQKFTDSLAVAKEKFTLKETPTECVADNSTSVVMAVIGSEVSNGSSSMDSSSRWQTFWENRGRC